VKQSSASRIPTKIGEFDRTLGGGIVPGSVVLLGGDPGIGKSTLVLEVARSIAGEIPVLYISGEESAEQVKLRADRLGELPPGLFILPETDVDRAVATIRDADYGLVIVDSIQSMRTGEIPAAAGSVSQVATGASRFQSVAKEQGPALLIIGHVTKDGSLAGPKTLEHLVDTVLYLEGERSGDIRLLRSVKNRFGKTDEIGLFTMTEKGMEELLDPAASLIDSNLQSLPGTVPTVLIEGARPLAVEIQALSTLSSLGYPKRTASGIDFDRLQLVIAVLTKRASLPLASQDVFVNVVGGIRVNEPGIGLPLALAIASALRNQPVARGIIAFGEVGLSGEIRPVSALERRIREAERLGYKQFLVPKGAIKPGKGVIPVATVIDALRACGVVSKGK
jgi:DNA repair protein RadA/Sms